MTSTTGVPAVHPRGEQPAVELAADGPVTAETFAGRVHLEWEHAAPVTTMGQLAFFIEYLKQGGLFESWVAGCPLHLTSPNAPAKRDVLGTVLLSVLVGVGQADKQVPPVAHQRDDAGHQPAAGEVLSGEAAPAPLVFQFVEIVLGIAAIAIQLSNGQQLGLQHRVFPGLPIGVELDKAQLQRRLRRRVVAGRTLR
jgi:hypothetical protein